MSASADGRRATRQDREANGLRELRLVVPDARSPLVRQRVAKAVASLDSEAENDALDWIEAVAEFDEGEPPNRS